MGKSSFRIGLTIILLIGAFLLLGCDSKTNEYDFFKIKNITVDKIEKVDVLYNNAKSRNLSQDEVQDLVELINTSSDEVQQYDGPSPKGVVNSLNIYLKSKSCFSLYACRNGYLLFCGEKSYIIVQPEYSGFAKNIFDKKSKV